MRNKATFTYRDLDEKLSSLGFSVHMQKGKARIYEHSPTGALVVLPDVSMDEEVLWRHLVAARHALESHDLGELDEVRNSHL